MTLPDTDDTNPLDSMPLADLRRHATWNADNAALCEQIEAEIARAGNGIRRATSVVGVYVPKDRGLIFQTQEQ